MCQDGQVNQLSESDFEAIRSVALRVTRNWTDIKAVMALRATGLEVPVGDRASLDAIAAELGVSRETVRRARNELLHRMNIPSTTFPTAALTPPVEPSAESPSTVRALRRVLTMTGPLAWDEILGAWARAGGKPPYCPLPADIESMRAWVGRAGGISLTPAPAGGRSTAAVDLPEALDQVSQFLYDNLLGKSTGLDRSTLLDAAEEAGLKATTIATTLSKHPAVTRIRRGTWALRGHGVSPNSSVPVREVRRTERARPTSFGWGTDGTLHLEFSIPRGPSPVVAVPKAVAELVEGREFGIESDGKPTRISVRNARLWGFGPLVSETGLVGGSRAVVEINLLNSTATFRPAQRKEPSR